MPSYYRKPRNSFFALASFLPVILIAACDSQTNQTAVAPAAPPAVTAVLVERQDVMQRFSFIGRVEAIDTVDVQARVEGFIESKSFVDGATVEVGDTLFSIESAQYQAEVDRVNAEIRGAVALHKEAEISLARRKKLIAKGAVSQSEVDEDEAVEAMRAADIKKLQATLKQAELKLSYTQMVSPIAGRIGRTQISVGNLVRPSDSPLAQIVSFDPIYVTIAISEKELMNARRVGFDKAATTVRPLLELSDGSLYEHDGRIDFVDNKVDPETDTITVRATFANPDQVLFPNQFVTMFVERTEAEATLVVPQSAVLEDQSGRFVLVVGSDNIAQVRPVKLGRQDGINFLVEEGLEAGEAVIVEGLQKVRPGLEVKPETISASTLTEG